MGEQEKNRLSSHKIRTLVVEDEEKIAVSICNKIQAVDPMFEIIGRASNGEEALKQIRECCPQVVFTDIAMPVMDGIELSRQIRSSNPNIMIVVISGYSDFTYAQQAIKYGVFNYLLKPLEEDALLETLFDIKKSLAHFAVRTPRHIIYSRNYQLIPEENERFVLAEICIGNVIYHVQDEEVLRFYSEQIQQIPWNGIMEQLWDETVEWYVADEQPPNQKVIARKAGKQTAGEVEHWMKRLLSLIQEYTDLPVSICSRKHSISKEEIWNDTKRMRYVIKQKLVIGENHIFYLEEEEITQNQILEIVKLKVNTQIRNYFISADLESFMSEIRTILKYLQNNHAPQESIEKLCFYVLKLLEFSDQTYEVQFLEEMQERMIRMISMTVLEEELFQGLLKEFYRLSSLLETIYEDKVEVRLLDYVDEHYLTIESVEQVAEEFGYNYAYLSRLFKKKAGEPMNRYIMNKKLSQARELLRTRPDMKLTQISDLCGYNDCKYFCRVFKNEVGMTPSEYRAVKEEEYKPNS